jgi:hypothetical protein
MVSPKASKPGKVLAKQLIRSCAVDKEFFCSVNRLVASLTQIRQGLEPKPFYVGFVMDKVALVQVIFRSLRSSPVSSLPPVLHTYSFIYHTRFIVL